MKKEESDHLEQKKAAIRNRLKNITKSRDKYLLYGLIAFTIILKLYYFFKTMDQAVWWDEGDYLAVAKELVNGGERPEWWSHFTGMRPLLMPLVWGFMFLINLPEPVVKFLTLLIPSVATVIITYKLGKDLYNKNVGLIAAVMLSVYWVHSFYTFRFLTDIPAMFFGMLAVYFFWSQYITNEKYSGLYLAMVFGVLAFSTRFPLALVPISFCIYLLSVRGLKIFKDKVFWRGIGFGALTLLPYMIYFIKTNFAVLQFYFGESAVSIKTPIWTAFKTILPQIPFLMKSIWFVCLLIGVASLYKLFIGFDLVFKQKTKELNSDYFIFLWAILTLFLYIVIVRAANDRWLLMLMPPLFYLSAKGIMILHNLVKKYSKSIAILIVLFLVFGGMYQHIDHNHKLIMSKTDTYQEEKLAGLWLKENTPEEARIVTASIVQNQYYSERQSYDFYTEKAKEIDCYDIYGNVKNTPDCLTKTEKFFEKKVKDIGADYMIIHIFEPVFTPPWAYSYPLRNPEKLEPIQAYLSADGSPILAIYKFKD